MYHFVAPIQTLSKSVSRLQYASKLAKEGALKAMGPFAAEMCAPYCFSLISNSLSDAESEASLSLLTEFVRCLKLPAIKSLILPTIQKILQVCSARQWHDSVYTHFLGSLLLYFFETPFRCKRKMRFIVFQRFSFEFLVSYYRDLYSNANPWKIYSGKKSLLLIHIIEGC